MRVLLCKIHCPFICFCKQSSQIYTPGPFKLENAPAPPLDVVVTRGALKNGNQDHKDDNSINANANANDGGIKSSLRINKSSPLVLQEEEEKEAESESQSDLPAQTHKKKVQWLDSLGKELAQIREFESSEAEEAEYEGISNRGCICSIL